MNRSRLLQHFEQTFGDKPQALSRAPGRVNLIGEHTDYNGGPVLPIALKQEICAAGRLRADRIVRIASLQFGDRYEGTLPAQRTNQPAWANYCLGVLAEYEKIDSHLPGLDLGIDGNVPLGSGLSSSAAIEVATAQLLAALLGRPMEPLDLALLCQRAENQFVGVNCGLMDQAASACCREDHALLLDCSTPAYRRVPFPHDRLTVVVAHSGVRRGLSESAYNERRSQCEQALEEINRLARADSPNLSSVPIEIFQQTADRLPEVLRRRSRHIITETARVFAAVERLEQNDSVSLGRLLNESHFSLRDDYAVSCPELDELSGLCRGFQGVYGSRLTGAGFGGCTVTLVAPDRASALLDHLKSVYYKPKQLEPLAFSTHPASGAEAFSVDG